MTPSGGLVLAATTTATPGVGPEELADFWPALIRFGWFLAGFAVVLLVGWVLVAPLVGRTIRRRNRDNPTITEAIVRYVRLFAVLAAVFVGAGVAGYGQFLSNSALVLAAGTLAIGVAGQTVIGSLVSGMVLVADPEFNVGNYIEWSGGEGEVASITLRVTRVNTPAGKLVTIPNEMLTAEEIARPYGRGRTRVVEHVGLAYEDDIEEGLRHLREAAEALDAVLEEPGPRAYVDDFGSDEVVLRSHFWIEDPRRKDVFGIRSAYARAVKDRLDAAGITISPASKRDLQGRIEIDRSEPMPS